jgi:hypothetical protein
MGWKATLGCPMMFCEDGLSSAAGILSPQGTC